MQGRRRARQGASPAAVRAANRFEGGMGYVICPGVDRTWQLSAVQGDGRFGSMSQGAEGGRTQSVRGCQRQSWGIFILLRRSVRPNTSRRTSHPRGEYPLSGESESLMTGCCIETPSWVGGDGVAHFRGCPRIRSRLDTHQQRGLINHFHKKTK
jgi:hypothetical protein